MELHKIVLVLLVTSLAALQGCCSQGGTWFPNANRPVRKQTHWDAPTQTQGNEFMKALAESLDSIY